ncbi:CASP-like protein 4B1 [Nymphaea thermarum]|nr:CASP-like protein 4B1 [Nymphaea thermarum]
MDAPPSENSPATAPPSWQAPHSWGSPASQMHGVASLPRTAATDSTKMITLVLTLLSLLFSFLSMVVMASNKTEGGNFTVLEEYSYLIAIATIACFYSLVQFVLLLLQLFSTSTNPVLPQRSVIAVVLFGSQVLAYLLISASSAAIPNTKRLRDLDRNEPFVEKAVASISMAFLAFVTFAAAALFSASKFFNPSA